MVDEVADETLQNLMVSIWRGAAQFRRLTLLRTWVNAIARRQALKTMRTPADFSLYESTNAPQEDLS